VTSRQTQTAARQIDRGPNRGLTQEQTFLVRTETVIDDDAPDPRPSRKTRRALARQARRTT
jgi:hypothetical protein